MSLNQYKGICFICGKEVPPRKGDFQNIGSLSKELKKNYTGANYRGKWLVRCFGCKGLGNNPLKLNEIKMPYNQRVRNENII